MRGVRVSERERKRIERFLNQKFRSESAYMEECRERITTVA